MICTSVDWKDLRTSLNILRVDQLSKILGICLVLGNPNSMTSMNIANSMNMADKTSCDGIMIIFIPSTTYITIFLETFYFKLCI